MTDELKAEIDKTIAEFQKREYDPFTKEKLADAVRSGVALGQSFTAASHPELTEKDLERYHNEPIFHGVVNYIVASLKEKYTPEDVASILRVTKARFDEVFYQ